MDYTKEFNQVKNDVPDFVSYVKKEYEDIVFRFLRIFLLILLINIDLIFFFPRYISSVSYIFALIGAYFVSIGAIKTVPQVVVLSMARIGYSKPLAHDLMRNSYLVAKGVLFVIFSLILQAI